MQTLDWWEDDVIAGIERMSPAQQLDEVTRQVEELTNSLDQDHAPLIRPWLS